MPEALERGVDGEDYIACLKELEGKQGVNKYAVCAASYEKHHEKVDGKWVRKKGHKKVDGKWEFEDEKDDIAEFDDGFDGFIEIFKGGRVVDSSGVEHDGNELIEKAINNFNIKEHEPPIVIGHPKNNDPAYGWVQELKTNEVNGNKILLAKLKDVVPEFKDVVRKGLFKKRSASFYPNGTLRHVGFLGAAVPAIKGLANLKFEDSTYILFYDNNETITKNLLLKEESMLIEKQQNKTEVVEKTIDKDFQEIDKKLTTLEDTVKKQNDTIKSYEKKIADMEFADKAKDLRNFLDNLKTKGIITPAMFDLGLTEFAESLLRSEINFEFSEKQFSALDWFKSFLESKKPEVLFEEVDSPENKAVDNKNFNELVDEYMKKENVNLKVAQLEIAKKYPKKLKIDI